MRSRAAAKGQDLILVDTGDRVEGAGLYDASSPKGIFLNDVLTAAPIDLLCTGNHELYKAYTAKREHDEVVPSFRDNYIASNLDYIDPDSGEVVPLAPRRFKRFKTPNQGIEVLATGWLFDFQGNANNTIVKPVEEVVKEQWFRDEFFAGNKKDLIVVIGHVGLRMREFKIIHDEIRKLDWDTPVVYFGGHVHVRDAVSYDSASFGLASGRYMETVGWMSVDGITPRGRTEVSAPSFSRRYIDNNLYGYHYHTTFDADTFPTPQGKHVSGLITKARKALHLDEKFGCAPKNLWMTRAPYPDKSSIYSWLVDEVLPDIIVNEERKHVPRFAVTNTGGIRFDIFQGRFTRDSVYLVMPFTNHFNYIKDVPYQVAKKVVPLLNTGDGILETDLRGLNIPEHRHENPDRRRSQHPLLNTPTDPELTAGYTTQDSIGDDGDDTLHARVDHFSVPNCVQAEIGMGEEEPQTVDFVFVDFVQPWVLRALRLAGGDYGVGDVGRYVEGSFSGEVMRWVGENWGGEC